ncbi:hypothetical protein ACFY9S_17475 [Streptomyces sp. NPDC012474]|uniref:hypothetical protein n=1 Tax=Streptomyces sp. NPDC012474 TaxID=3364836 RepID=UPI0036E7070C
MLRVFLGDHACRGAKPHPCEGDALFLAATEEKTAADARPRGPAPVDLRRAAARTCRGSGRIGSRCNNRRPVSFRSSEEQS